MEGWSKGWQELFLQLCEDYMQVGESKDSSIIHAYALLLTRREGKRRGYKWWQWPDGWWKWGEKPEQEYKPVVNKQEEIPF